LDAGQRRLIAPGDEIQVGSVLLVIDGDGDDAYTVEGAGPRIRVVEGPNFGDELALAEEDREYVVGRSPKADLVLEDREVSREHIKVVRRGFTVFLYDAASTRGSWLGRAAVYQGLRIEWQSPRMLKLGATVLALELPRAARAAVQASPMTPPPRVYGAANAVLPFGGVPATHAGPSLDVVAYHYEAQPQEEPGARPPSHPPSTRPSAWNAASASPRLPNGTSSPPASVSRTNSNKGSLPPLPETRLPPAGRRKAWKKDGVRIGGASGLLLLGLATLAILGALFVVFSLME
ncbi:MAG TPA: FHA domain-containing protein, partial [Labilithrix sp.]|nr:FHA domain-containing protein [Labilithrix sp.]